MSSLKRYAAAGLLAGFLLAVPHTAEAVVVERVVAVVAEKAILLSDLRKRAEPFLIRLHTQVPAGPQRAAAESKVYSQLINKMVEEELEAAAATRQNLRVTAEEVDKALQRIAAAGRVPLSKLFENVERESGMTEVEYRQEIRRQVLEGKLLNRFIANARITDQEIEEMFNRVRKQERVLQLYKPGWIVLRLGKEPKPELVQKRSEEMQDILRRLRAGEDFGELARKLSEDDKTKAKGGDLGTRVPATSPRAMTGKYRKLNRSLENKVVRLGIGEYSEPFRFMDALVVMTIINREPSRYTSLNAARAEMMERVRGEKLQRVKERWIGDLRRRTHVDIRL